MKKIMLLLFVSFLFLPLLAQTDVLNLSGEYSKDYFERGIRAFHNTQYELAISEFVKSLSFQNDNYLSRLFLGESYRKAGYEKNTLYAWNSLMSMGYEDRALKNKITYLYNRRGMLSDIFVDKNYIVRTDIRGYYEGENFVTFLNPSQIAVDQANHYYISSFATGSLVELDSNLQIVRTILTANPPLRKPFGVAVASDGEIYVSDFANDRILKINPFNFVTQTIGFKGIGEGGLLGPKYLTLDEQENIYVVDSGNQRINKYGVNGAILHSFGTKGEGKLLEPGGMFYRAGELFVADRKRNEIVVFDSSGNYLRAFGSEYLEKPYDLTVDRLGRLIILCEKKMWAYEPESGLKYGIESVGERLQRGVSVAVDREDNILVSDFNSSRVFLLSLERRRYNNLYVGVERVISSKFPDVHLLVRVEKDDFTAPVGLTPKNITVYENNKHVPIVGLGYTEELNNTVDVAVLFDNSPSMLHYRKEFQVIMDSWMRSSQQNTNVSLIHCVDGRAVVFKELGSTRLELLDGIERVSASKTVDKGEMFKIASYDFIDRFSKKNVILVTDGKDTGNDFERFKIEDMIQFALNNDIRIYVAAFAEGNLSSVYRNMAERTGGDYLQVYQRRDLKDLFQKMGEEKGKQYVFSYLSDSISRFGREPIKVEVEVNYSGMKGLGETIYFPPRQ